MHKFSCLFQNYRQRLTKKLTKVVSFQRLLGTKMTSGSLISPQTAEISDDCVSKFASLMRARD